MPRRSTTLIRRTRPACCAVFQPRWRTRNFTTKAVLPGLREPCSSLVDADARRSRRSNVDRGALLVSLHHLQCLSIERPFEWFMHKSWSIIMHYYKKPQIVSSLAMIESEDKNNCFICLNSFLLELRKMSERARILVCSTEDKLQNSNDYLRQIDCLGFAGSVAKRDASCQTPHIACRDSFRKPGPSYPVLFFPCSPARDRFALRRRSLLPKAFAPPLPGRVSA